MTIIKVALLVCGLAISASAQTYQAPLVRSQQYGAYVTSIGYISPNANTPHEPLYVEIGGSNVGAFGDVVADERTPVLQMDFVYGFNDQTSTRSVNGSGVVVSSHSRLMLQTGTTATSSATFNSVLPARYRPGQGMMARFTGIWTSSATNSKQIIGVADNGDGYFFGYNGTQFGILHKNRGNENWYYQGSWNHDNVDGTGASGIVWDKTKGNILQIQYPFLGYGNIKFYIQEENHGHMMLVHEIRYTNTTNETQVSNPSLKFKAYVENTGNTTNLNMYVGSVGVFLVGKKEYLGPQFSEHFQKASITTETNLITFKNSGSFNGVINTSVLRIRSLSVASDGGNSLGVFHLTKNTTLGGTPSWRAISGVIASSGAVITSGQSSVSYDTAGTTLTGGVPVFEIVIPRNAGQLHDLTPYNIFLSPNETLTISGEALGSASSLGASMSWNEDN